MPWYWEEEHTEPLDTRIFKIIRENINVENNYLTVRTDPTNEDLTRVKQKNRILDHPKIF